jgi:hypothetical protein
VCDFSASGWLVSKLQWILFITNVTVHSEHTFCDCYNATKWTLFIAIVTLHSGYFLLHSGHIFTAVVTVYTGNFVTIRTTGVDIDKLVIMLIAGVMQP